MSLFIKKVLFPVLISVSVFAIILYLLKDNKQTTNNQVYVLKSYKNTVALYKNDKPVDVYESIVLNTLPQKDVQNFNNGIFFDTEEQAESYLEDYDG